MHSEDDSELIYGLSEKDRNLIISFILKFGLFSGSIDDIFDKFTATTKCPKIEQNKKGFVAFFKSICRYLLLFDILVQNSVEIWPFEYFPDGVGVGLLPEKLCQELLSRVSFFAAVKQILKDPTCLLFMGSFKLFAKFQLFPGLKTGSWGIDHDCFLLTSLLDIGYGKWSEISKQNFDNMTIGDIAIEMFVKEFKILNNSEDVPEEKLTHFQRNLSKWIKKRITSIVDFHDRQQFMSNISKSLTIS
ncbi:hypothetical protein GEMRC1_000765 [Eukaryota sp. GEM-RC1]